MELSQIMPRWNTSSDPEEKTEVSEEDRLLNLFWNRAELKKEFSNLRHDRDHLIERLRDQEKMTEGVRKQVRNMEKMLADPDAGYRAIVFYQLRGLWKVCHKQLAKFSEQLKKQQQDRERKRQIMEFNQERQKRMTEVSGRIVSVKAEVDDLKHVVAGYESQREALRGFWNYFKRRDLQVTIDEQRARLAVVRGRLEELFDRRIKIESEQWPDYAGLGTGGKRAINVAMIALSQHLFLQLTDRSVSTLARTANVKKLDEVNYGGRTDCEYLMKTISELTSGLMSDRNYADELRARTEMLKKQIEYNNDADTIPNAESFARMETSIPGFDPGRVVSSMPLEVNVLADDYWDVQKLLLK